MLGVKNKTYEILNTIIALAWIANGLFCKILNLVPRHQEIVSKIISNKNARNLTIVIGLLEISMAAWVLSEYKQKINVITQIVIVATMNIIEFIIVPDLLLWGKLNILFASLFIILLYYNGFYLKHKKHVL